MLAFCLQCNKKYDIFKSRADFRGYCSQRCMKEKAKSFGWKQSEDRNGYGIYPLLKRAKQIGDLMKGK